MSDLVVVLLCAAASVGLAFVIEWTVWVVVSRSPLLEDEPSQLDAWDGCGRRSAAPGDYENRPRKA